MRTALCIAFLALAAPAQNYVVSPAGYANLEGHSNNTYPWSSTFRYQQGHTDLTGTPRAFLGLAWRRNQDQFLPTSSGPKTLDMEVNMCDSNVAAWSSTFASNYVGTPVNVFLRKQVNTPDWRPPIVQRPAPFDYAILFDAPYVYLAVNDLLYEIFVYTNSSSSSFQCDASGGTGTSAYGSYTSAGAGCTTGNGTFLLRSNITHVMSSSTISFAWNVIGAPATANGALLLGLAPLDLPVPGLCTNLYTDATVLSVPFTASAAGVANTTAVTTPYNPAWAALVVTAQAAALDASQPGLPLAATQGVRSEIPPALPPTNGARAWALGNPTATSGSSSRTSWLVTQFRY